MTTILRRYALNVLDDVIGTEGLTDDGTRTAVTMLRHAGMRPSASTTSLALEARAAFLEVARDPSAVHLHNDNIQPGCTDEAGSVFLRRACATYDGCLDLLVASAL